MSQHPDDNAADALLAGAGLNDQQMAAMQVAEAARSDGGRSFAGQLFMGSYEPEQLHPFPTQDDDDRRTGDEFVERVSAFLAEHLDADEVDDTRTVPAVIVEALQEMGVFRMKVPEAYGGLGFSQVNYNRVLMAIASHCGSTAVLVSAHQSIGVPQPLKMFGTEQQKQTWLPRIANGALSAFALTEPEVGSDPARMTTTAVLSDDGSHYVLNGVKQWTTNGPIAELLVVMARTAPKMVRGKERTQITAFIVETDTPGVETTHRCDFMGLRGIQNGIMRFTDVRVPAANVLLGEGQGLKLALKTLNTGRLTLPAACTGMGKQCLSIARRWSADRVQWGLPIGRHEAGREKIADIAAGTFAMEAVTWLTSHWADQNRDIRIEAAMAKLFCSETSWMIVDQTMQLRGGRGYERAESLRQRGEDPWPVERMMRDARINTIIEGTSDIMRLFLAREALDPHLKVAGDLLRPGIGLVRRFKALGGVMAFYAKWYPKQLWGRLFPRRHRAYGRLASHYRFADRNAHRLAASLFGAMARYGPKLERQQVLLGRLMDIGTELFVMTASCAYAESLATRNEAGDTARMLADTACRLSRQRIKQLFRGTPGRDRRRANELAGRVLDGECRWLEQGIIEAPGAQTPAADVVERCA